MHFQEDFQEDFQKDFQENSQDSQPESSLSRKRIYNIEIGENDICQVFIKKNGIEKKCETEYFHDKSTSNIIAHLRSSHNIIDDKKLKSEVQQIRQTKLPEIINVNTPYKGIKQSEINKAGFRQMMAKIDPKFRPTSNWLIKNQIALSYLKNVESLQHEIASCQNVTITADI
ncbi:3482_t:CDS:2 [Racocetra fulgida]|uniref:3482_t:CDS:1 n=1 Tax=Racocetra fulgida TaxID=60492 RepID=A0A9N9N8Z2_9GLOM|nr:3482_t:CDS:2 [Racocetra fulgida]